MSSVLRLFSRNSALLRRNLPTSVLVPSAVAVNQYPKPTSSIGSGAIISQTRFLTLNATCRSVDKSPEADASGGDNSTAATIAADEHNPLDRTRIITLEESLRYLASDAYRQTYGDQPVWVQYRRNHKGPFAPRRTRRTCVRQGLISSGNPCPICRDEYLLLDHRNLELLHQFISPHTGEILSYSKTGLCQKKHQQLVIAIERAQDQGLITFDVPFRQYDYAEYYPTELLAKHGLAAKSD